MSQKILSRVVILTLLLALVVSACGPKVTEEPEGEFVFGVIMVGPYNDHGWSEAHYEAGKYVEAHLPNSKMIYLDKLNSADRPETTVEQAVDDMFSQGAQINHTS
ncbi:MAG: BMP family ABC transporter substrate-binding protein, partial [Anaerolineae bacterium]|nr:BMP family ABC transporter substrate-binding protein [Anaerolineae bacterium]